jgi:hypothetical protein
VCMYSVTGSLQSHMMLLVSALAHNRSSCSDVSFTLPLTLGSLLPLQRPSPRPAKQREPGAGHV